MKKLFITSLTLLVIVLIFLGIYNFAFKKEGNSSAEQISAQQKEQVSNAENNAFEKNKKISMIVPEAVAGFTIDKKTQDIKYYEAKNGTAWKVDTNGKNKQQLSDMKISGLKNVLWSMDQARSLLYSKKENQNVFYEYDYSGKKNTVLKSGLDTAVWDNLGTKILYKYYEGGTGKRSLNIANPDGSDWQKIADIENRDILISPVPLTSIVSFWNYPSAKEETKLQVVGLTGGEVKTILTGKFGADYAWAPNGAQALVSSLSAKDNKTISLGVVTADGLYQDLNIPTLVSKCAWSADSRTIYYALPGNIPSDALMPNDYLENKFTTADTFWKMDITTGEKVRIVEVGEILEKYDSSNIMLSPTEDALYFINKIDQKLYKIEL